MSCYSKKIRVKGYVKVVNCVKQWDTFTQDLTYGGKLGWEYVEMEYDFSGTTTSTTTT